MNGTGRTGFDSAGSIIGWLVLAAGIAQVPTAMAAFFAARIVPGAGTILLLLMAVMTGLLLVVGGIGLILQRVFAYYCVYAVTFFGGMGGFKNPYIPFLKRLVNIGPATEDLFLALNLVITAILVWEHWRLVGGFESSKQRFHRALIVGFAIVGAGWVLAGQASTHRERGEKNTAGALPVVGASFADFVTSWRLAFVSVETRMPRGVTLVFAGSSSEAAIEKLAETHHLTKMDDPRAHKKFLLLAKAWKLDPTVFVTAFSDEDSYYAGRLKEMPKVTLQIVYRQSDGRFTAQVFGIPPKR